MSSYAESGRAPRTLTEREQRLLTEGFDPCSTVRRGVVPRTTGPTAKKKMEAALRLRRNEGRDLLAAHRGSLVCTCLSLLHHGIRSRTDSQLGVGCLHSTHTSGSEDHSYGTISGFSVASCPPEALQIGKSRGRFCDTRAPMVLEISPFFHTHAWHRS